MKERTGMLIVTLLVLGAGSLAAEGPPIAEIENYGDKLLFHPVVEFERLVLTVTGPCAYEFQEVVSDGDITFRLDDTTIDGAYTYQLVRIEKISEEIIAILEQARAQGDEDKPKELCRDGKLPGPPIVQAEGFQVVKGEIIYDHDTIEKAFSDGQDTSGGAAPGRIPTKDHVINDDLIVTRSICVGFDCVSGESFGFDTIRLKEHNLRIKFYDTSTSSSFPSNDWQLAANSSSNGGASMFSIDDISSGRTPFMVEAGARSHSLHVDDSGRIGSRTSTPTVEFHTIDGDTPTVRLQQDTSSGYSAQAWDVAGNENNFFVRDVTNGSRLPLRIQPGAPTSSLTIMASGYVGVGTWSPDDRLHLEAGGGELPGIRIVNTDVDSQGWAFRVVDADEFRISKQSVPGAEFRLDASGNLTISGDIVSGGTTYVPDYVFEPDYSLLPLSELAAFIARQKHLPGIPSAAQVEAKGGLNMTGMQMRLLEKIEELTLYTLSQQETIKTLLATRDTVLAQQEIIRELQARLTALENAAGEDR